MTGVVTAETQTVRRCNGQAPVVTLAATPTASNTATLDAVRVGTLDLLAFESAKASGNY
jgi:hypothetical protein